MDKNVLIKICFTIICLIACSVQIGTIITMYLQYPYTSAVIRSPLKKLYVPGITLCNSNRSQMWLQMFLFGSDESNDTDDSSNEDRIKQQRMMDWTLLQMMREMTVSEFMSYGHTVEDFINISYTRCASDKLYPDNPCRDLMNVITTVSDEGNCFTLFHNSQSKDLRELAIPPGFAQWPIKKGRDSVSEEISEEAIHPNEVIRLMVNFRKEEYMAHNEPVMGQIIVHDDNEIPIIREKSFHIEPGHYYIIYMTREISRLLPKPYDTNCKKYVNIKTKNYNPFLHNPLSKNDCKIGCMAQFAMDLCECWPPEVPFIKGSEELAQENQMKWCDWNQTLLEFQMNVQARIKLKVNQTLFDYCFSDYEEECEHKCNKNCLLKYYRLNHDIRVWPSKERIQYSENKEYLNRMHNCCAIISLRYWGTQSSVNDFQPKLQITEIICYIGGLLSMWIGFSFLWLYDLTAQLFIYVSGIQIKREKHLFTKRAARLGNNDSRLMLRQNNFRYHLGYYEKKAYY